MLNLVFHGKKIKVFFFNPTYDHEPLQINNVIFGTTIWLKNFDEKFARQNQVFAIDNEHSSIETLLNILNTEWRNSFKRASFFLFWNFICILRTISIPSSDIRNEMKRPTWRKVKWNEMKWREQKFLSSFPSPKSHPALGSRRLSPIGEILRS
jgi:hypothetical protein